MTVKTKRKYAYDTLRSLWIKSGNQCAHPECRTSLLDDSGVFISEIAHIEGLKTGSARYNSAMTDEERNNEKNLILLCPTHHTNMDKNKKLTVEEIKKWKLNHEKKYSDVAHIFQGVLSDYTACIEIKYPKNLMCLNIGELNEEERNETLEIFCENINKLKPIPNSTKSFFAIAISRAIDYSHSEFKVDLEEICEVAHISTKEATKHIHILETHKLAFYDDDEPGRHLLKIIPDVDTRWNIWRDIQICFKKMLMI